MNLFEESQALETRRHFFARGKHLLGGAALTSLLSQAMNPSTASAAGHVPVGAHFPPKAKRVIYLHMVGGPAQMDLFDYKPVMQEWYDKDLPDSVRMGQRLTTMTSGQARFPIAPSKFKFSAAGECGMMMNTELLPNLAKKADEICWMRSLHTEAINHEPAIAAMQTGNQVTGRPCLGSWASYGLGSDNENLPAFVVLVAVPTNREQEQAISARLWSAGYLPGEHSGVSFRSKGDPILYINNPPGVPAAMRKRSIDGLNALNELNYKAIGDPEIHTRIQQYEMAFRMQASVPELMDLSNEPKHILEMYGTEGSDGSYAANCLLARRLAERGVRFIHLYHRGWDHHGDLVPYMNTCCGLTDKPTWALITDLKQRGLLEDTLIIWGGEFGRTPMFQGKGGAGRDHWAPLSTLALAGGGLKMGQVVGESAEKVDVPKTTPITPQDLLATVYRHLDIDPSTTLTDLTGRPVHILGSGKPIAELL